jgi:hypothetical protein
LGRASKVRGRARAVGRDSAVGLGTVPDDY